VYERRVIILLVLLALGFGVLLLRAGQMQLVQHSAWEQFVAGELNRSALVETTRGRIVDRKGRVLAKDEPCIDARVDFRALVEPADEEWVKWTAYRRARQRADYSSSVWEAEKLAVIADLERLWDELAAAGGVGRAEIDALRHEIADRVADRRAYLARRRHAAATAEWEAGGRPAWWRRWLLGETGEAPKLEDFDEKIEEELQTHILVRDLPQTAQNRLEKLKHELPGLYLEPGMRRVYPHGEVAAHLIGRIGKVAREDLADDPAADERLRRYLPNDLIGRQGLERLAEPTLRGIRGSVYEVHVETAGDNATVNRQRIEPSAGRDVRATIDIAVQSDLQAALQNVRSPNIVNFGRDRSVEKYSRKPMPGAAAVVDIETGDVLAMASYPSFDPNTYDEDYEKLVEDAVNLPLLNRATLAPREVGSTMKVLTGIAGIAEGVVAADERIECDGYLHLPYERRDGTTVMRTLQTGRCWTQSMFGDLGRHHAIGGGDPHPTGLLRYDEALQRSCNVYFETVGDRLKLDALGEWQRRFGLGEPVGIGLPERGGRTSEEFRGDATERRSESWFNAIGQGQVQATPLQMAAAIAAVARRGEWVQPRVVDDVPQQRWQINAPSRAWDLAISGMADVVHTRAGTGRTGFGQYLEETFPDLRLAAKTGTASASRLRVKDEAGIWQYVPFAATNLTADADRNGDGQLDDAEALVPDRAAGATAPWYHTLTRYDMAARGYVVHLDSSGNLQAQSHSWCVGFAPAQNPTVAFAIMIDHGGSGGTAAGSVAVELVKSLKAHGYVE
jgi:penicillin-binding protein 2